MTTAARLCSVYLAIVGLAVAAHFIAVPLYHPGGDEPYPIWDVLNYFTGAAILIALAGSGAVKWRTDPAGSADTVRFITSSVVFYSVLTLGILFFWNWRGGDDSLIWNFIDTALPLALVAAGRQLWQRGRHTRRCRRGAHPAPRPAPPLGRGRPAPGRSRLLLAGRRLRRRRQVHRRRVLAGLDGAELPHGGRRR